MKIRALALVAFLAVSRFGVAAVPTVTLTVDPVARTIAWTATLSTGCSASAVPAVSSWSGPLASSGSLPLPVATVATTLTLSCAAATGSAVVSWTAPTLETDGSSLTDLASYVVYAASSPNAVNMVRVATATVPSMSQKVNVPVGLNYFTVKAVDATGDMSDFSASVSKTVTADAAGIATVSLQPVVPKAPTNVTVT